MGHILNLALLGVFAGALSGFLTRIAKKDMIFGRLGKRMERYNNDHLIMFKEPSKTVFLLTCVFCMTPYIVVFFDVVYIIYYAPAFSLCFVGVLSGLGMGNLVAEIIYKLRGNS